MGDTNFLGKCGEHKIFSMLLECEADVYAPLCDNNGIDCVVRRKDGSFALVQIKTNGGKGDEPYKFNVQNHEQMENYYFVLYAQKSEDIWVIPSKDFVNMASPVTKGGFIIDLSTKIHKDEYDKYKVKDTADLVARLS